MGYKKGSKDGYNNHNPDAGSGGVSKTYVDDKLATKADKSSVGTLTNLTTTDQTNLVNAVNEVDSHVDGAVNTANQASSDATTALTEANNNKAAIGNTQSLTTTAISDLVSAVNEVDAHADQANNDIASAKAEADQASTDASNALSTANTAQTTANANQTELVNARTNNRGKVFDALDARLDAVDIDLKERAVNVKWYGASGSDQTTTGSIDAASSVLTVADVIDFEVGQGIAVESAGPNSVKEVASLQITAAATASGNVNVTLDGITTTVSVTSGDSAITIADKIRNVVFSNWTTGGTVGTDTVTFTANTFGDKTDATYSAGTTGATGTMTTTQGVSDPLISKIIDISGTTITLRDIAGTTVSGTIVEHDDTEVFRTVADNGSEEIMAVGDSFKISSPVTFNNKVKLISNHNTIIDFRGIGNTFELNVDGSYISGLIFKTVNSLDSGQIKVNAQNCNILKNRFEGKSYSGIFMGPDAKNTLIAFNHIEGYKYGVLGETSNNSIIVHNFFTGGFQEGISSDPNLATNKGQGYGWDVQLPLGDGIKLSAYDQSSQNTGAHYNIIANNIFDSTYRDAIDMFSDGSETIFTGNIARNIPTKGLDIKVIYRDDPNNGGTSIEDIRQLKNLTVTDNRFYDIGTMYDDNVLNIEHVESRSGMTANVANGVNHVLVIANHFRGVANNAVYINTAFAINVSDNFFEEVDGDNVYIVGGSEKIAIKGNNIKSKKGGIISSSSGNADIQIIANLIHLDPNIATNETGIIARDGALVANNIVDGFQVGIDMYGTTRGSVWANKIKNCTLAGIRVGEFGNVSTSTIKNNDILNCQRAILYSEGDNIVSIGNVAINCPNGFVNESIVTNFHSANNFMIP